MCHLTNYGPSRIRLSCYMSKKASPLIVETHPFQSNIGPPVLSHYNVHNQNHRNELFVGSLLLLFVPHL